MRNLRRIQFAIQEEQPYAECGTRLKNFHSSNFVFVPLFWKPILTKQNIASPKDSQQFLASQVCVWRRNKATNSSTSYHPFFSCTESPYTWYNLFKLFRLVVTLAREVCHLGKEMKKNMTIVSFFLLSPMANFSCECDGRFNKPEKITQCKGFRCSENGSVEVLELVALFLLKTVTFGAKIW